MSPGILFGNRILDVVFISWASAQGYKVISEIITTKKFTLGTLWGTGGMPSSHSSTVTSLAASVGIIDGFQGLHFAMAMGFAAVVMYDASGIRRAAGKQAGIINRLMEKIHQNHYLNMSGVQEEKLKELLGHTPVEVMVGAILGVVVSYLMRGYLLG